MNKQWGWGKGTEPAVHNWYFTIRFEPEFVLDFSAHICTKELMLSFSVFGLWVSLDGYWGK